jgi:hypothetical protein
MTAALFAMDPTNRSRVHALKPSRPNGTGAFFHDLLANVD